MRFLRRKFGGMYRLASCLGAQVNMRSLLTAHETG
jgi:hypothetical protein